MSVLTRQQRCARDLLFFTAPSLWAFWPFLPLVRHRPDGARPELGVLYDARGVSGRLGMSATVFIVLCGDPHNPLVSITREFVFPAPDRSRVPPPAQVHLRHLRGTCRRRLDRGLTARLGRLLHPDSQTTTSRRTTGIGISRALARRFRAVLRQSLAGPRGDAPLILCRAGPVGLTLEARRDDVAVRYQEDGPRAPDAIAFCAGVLAEFEGLIAAPVTLEQVTFGKGRAHWDDGSVPRVVDIETVTPDSVSPFPEVPKRFAAQPTKLLHALDEAARTTAKESGRLALARIQMRGRNGEVVATDGPQLLMQSGFDFPWQEDLLVPRVLAFGCRELAAQEQPVGVGRTETHVAIRVGPWRFLLAIDKISRFPEVEAVLPKANSTKSRLQLSPHDAAFLASSLPKLPGRDGEHEPVTLELAQPPTVRARAIGEGPATEAILAYSAAFGPPVRLNMDRRLLFRAVKLGFREIQVARADQPLACREGQLTYVWMPLEKSDAIAPGPGSVRISSADSASATPSTPTESTAPKRRRTPMPNPTPRNPPSNNGGTGPPERGVGLAELIEEVEALRAALVDATGRATRLLAGLKQQKRQSRALEAAVATLRGLRLGP